MKTKMNILCVLIFMAIGASFINYFGNNWGELTQSFMSGINEGRNHHPRCSEKNGKKASFQNCKELYFMDVEPIDREIFTDSVYNEKIDKWVPVQHTKFILEQDGRGFLNYTSWALFLISLFSFVLLITTLTQLVVFIMFIVAINKSVIFHWGNVLKLRIMGCAMLLSFIANAIITYIDYQAKISVISIPGYVLRNSDMWDFTLLIPGLGILLVGEIFAIGLRLKEEQELTI